MGNCLPSQGAGLDIEPVLSDEDIERLRTIFLGIADTETTDGQKALSITELLHMSALLGEPHTEVEAAEAVKQFHGAELGAGGAPVIAFDEFVKWWEWEHAAAEHGHRGRQYTERFKLSIEELHAPFDLRKLSREERGAAGSLEWRMHFFFDDDEGRRPISPWHQIPLWADGRGGKHEVGSPVHFVCEIPQGTRAKFEIAPAEVGNPIHQDVKKGAVRSYHADYPMPHNYGALPQTWEDPAVVDKDTGYAGDNDPLDAVEVGGAAMACGGVARVKVLGALAMIDDGETDWKLVVVAEGTELYDKVNSCEDVEAQRPGVLAELREWFRDYKLPDGKPKNAFGLDEAYSSAAYAHEHCLCETHEMWEQLMRRRKLETDGED